MCCALHHIAVTGQVLDFSFCAALYDPPILSSIINIVQITLGAPMCLLVVIQFFKEALQVYKATKRIRMNRYMNLLARESIIYFLVYVHVTFFRLFHSYTDDDG